MQHFFIFMSEALSSLSLNLVKYHQKTKSNNVQVAMFYQLLTPAFYE